MSLAVLLETPIKFQPVFTPLLHQLKPIWSDPDIAPQHMGPMFPSMSLSDRLHWETRRGVSKAWPHIEKAPTSKHANLFFKKTSHELRIQLREFSNPQKQLAERMFPQGQHPESGTTVVQGWQIPSWATEILAVSSMWYWFWRYERLKSERVTESFSSASKSS